MSTNWVDGSWNGVFMTNNIYVTADGSGNPANWGTPVAASDWFWPNRQERKDVFFARKSGRYVYFQRVSAWGWYGPQDPNWANYGYPPGYAGANEVYVYQRNSLWPSAIDTDSDGIPDYLEDSNGNGVYDSTLDLANWTSSDTRGEGIPDGWQWNYFGSLQPAAGDYDGDGVSNFQEYLGGTDPNKIQFAVVVTNQYVNSGVVPAQLLVTGGMPFTSAVLMDSTNFPSASWLGYSSNLTVSLGSYQGWHDVWVGLRGRMVTSEQTWHRQRLKLDQTPPTIVITNPVSSTTSQPVIQIQGYCPEPLTTLTYDLANSATNYTGKLGFVLSQWFDTNTYVVTTNSFQLFDVALAGGTNTIIVHAIDLAGNTTNVTLSYTLDLSNDHTPPGITVFWPQNGEAVATDTVDLRGQLDDPTATITVSELTNTPVQAVVERNGQFWVQSLPVPATTNTFMIIATNAASNVSTQILTVIRSPVNITIDPPSTSDLASSYLSSVTGTVSDNQHSLWVNGVRATVNSDRTWQAVMVPLNTGGTVILQARAIPLSSNGGNGQTPAGGNGSNPNDPNAATTENQTERDYYVYPDNVSSLLDTDTTKCTPLAGDQVQHETQRMSVFAGSGGYQGTTWLLGGPPPQSTVNFLYFYPDIFLEGIDVGSQQNIGYLNWAFECMNVTDNKVSTGNCPGHDNYQRSASTLLRLHSGNGKAIPNATLRNLFAIHVSAQHLIEPRAFPPYVGTPAADIAPTQITIRGQIAGADGFLYMALPDDADIDITPQIVDDHYIYDVTATRYRLLIDANGTTLDPNATNAHFCVGQTITFAPSWDPASPSIQSNTNLWALDGDFRNDQTNAVVGLTFPTCSAVPYINSSFLANEVATNNWWVSGGSTSPGACYSVHLGKALVLSNGQKVQVMAESHFSMYRPFVTVTSTTGTIAVDNNYDYFGLHYGTGEKPGQPGIRFTASPLALAGFTGEGEWGQVIDSLVARVYR
jgi:hypothetical protein